MPTAKAVGCGDADNTNTPTARAVGSGDADDTHTHQPATEGSTNIATEGFSPRQRKHNRPTAKAVGCGEFTYKFYSYSLTGISPMVA